MTTRTWYRPNPPLAKVKWSIRNNINLQQSALLLAMHYVADHKQTFLENFYLKSKRSVAKATSEGPAAWVMPADDPRPLECGRPGEPAPVAGRRGAPPRPGRGNYISGGQRGEEIPLPGRQLRYPDGSAL